MIVSINQPAYLPWLGYFHRIAASDVHVVLDHVQFEKNSFTNRNKVRTAGGWCWLTVPVRTKGQFGDLPINRLEIDHSVAWGRKHWETLRQCYGRAPHFAEYSVFFESIFNREWTTLAPLCRELASYMLDVLGIQRKILFSSELECQGSKDELILEICRRVGASVYLSGALGSNYLRQDLFQEAGIKVRYQDYRHPEYAQMYQPFEPCMASVDLLFNYGPGSLEVLMRGQEEIAR